MGSAETVADCGSAVVEEGVVVFLVYEFEVLGYEVFYDCMVDHFG